MTCGCWWWWCCCCCGGCWICCGSWIGGDGGTGPVCPVCAVGGKLWWTKCSLGGFLPSVGPTAILLFESTVNQFAYSNIHGIHYNFVSLFFHNTFKFFFYIKITREIYIFFLVLEFFFLVFKIFIGEHHKQSPQDIPRYWKYLYRQTGWLLEWFIKIIILCVYYPYH